MSTMVLVVVLVVATLVVIAGVAFAIRQSRRRALRNRFGPEYDHVIDVTDKRRDAERDLRERETRHEQLDIRELSPAAASRYQEQWLLVQQRFVDEPAQAVTDAQSLVTTVMRERGYPTGDGDERESMLSVDHADVMDRYRAATGIEAASRTGKASTEQLRQATQHYRALFERLLGDAQAAPATSGAVSGRRGTRAGPDA